MQLEPATTGACAATHRQDAAPPLARRWAAEAVAFLAEERRRAADTPMIKLDCEGFPGIEILIKDETAHPSGSLKHRLAHALFVHAICNGEIGPDTPIVEASSGSTAISEAWFAQRLGLRFTAVVPASTAPAKLQAIREMGAEVVAVEGGEDICERAEALARECGGHFMNQFVRAAEATDWRGANNIAQSLFGQAEAQGHASPAWVVAGAGTGGTSATIGRYMRLRPELASTRLCVVDPCGSALFEAFRAADLTRTGKCSAVVEGIGRPRVEPAFNPRVVDAMISVPDRASVAGAHWLRDRTGTAFGPSTGTNVIGTLFLARAMQWEGRTGALITLACDKGARYDETIYNAEWLASAELGPSDWHALPSRLHDVTIEYAPGAARER